MNDIKKGYINNKGSWVQSTHNIDCRCKICTPSKEKNDKAWEKYKSDCNQDRQFAPVFFTGNEFENIEKEEIKYYIKKHCIKVIFLFLLAVAGLVFLLA